MSSENPSSENASSENASPENVSSEAPDFQEFVGKKLAAGICGILLGSLGIHKFILGFTTAGIIMLGATIGAVVLTPCTVGLSIFGNVAIGVIGLIEGILYLTKSDQEFYDTYAVKKKDWF